MLRAICQFAQFFEITHAHFANFWSRPGSNPNPNINPNPRINRNPDPITVT